MRHIATYLLFILVVLLASCRSTRDTAMCQPDTKVLSTEEQRKYEYYFLEGIRLEQQERYDEAFEMFNHCLAIDSAPSALYKIANYYFFLNQKDRAIDALLRTVEEAPDNYWYWQTLASYYQTNHEYEKAINTLETMLQSFPKHTGEQLVALVGLYSHTGQYSKVIDMLSRLETLKGKSETISMEKCRNYLLMGDKEGAFTEMESLVAEYPEDAYFRVIQAEVYMDHGRVHDAESLLRSILAEEPDNGPAKVALAQYYKQTADTVRYHALTDSVIMSANVNDDVKATIVMQLITEGTDSTYMMNLLERAIALPQQTARLGSICVQYMLSLQQPEERVRPILLRMLEIEPDYVHARLQLVAYAARRDNIEELIAICSEGIDYNPESIEFYYYKALGLFQLGDHNGALNTFEKAIGQVTKESDGKLVSDIYATMGDLYQMQENSEEAYKCYDSALAYNPSNIVVLNNYAYRLSEEGVQLDKAEQMSLRTIKAEPDNATYLDTYAWILFQKGEYTEAFTYIEKALKVDIEPSDVLYEHAGDICYRAGDTQKALTYWMQALEIQRNTQTVDKRLVKKIKEKKM